MNDRSIRVTVHSSKKRRKTTHKQLVGLGPSANSRAGPSASTSSHHEYNTPSQFTAPNPACYLPYIPSSDGLLDLSSDHIASSDGYDYDLDPESSTELPAILVDDSLETDDATSHQDAVHQIQEIPAEKPKRVSNRSIFTSTVPDLRVSTLVNRS
jgi:hypothetical protein